MNQFATKFCMIIGIITIAVAIIWLFLWIRYLIINSIGEYLWKAEKERLRSDMIGVRVLCFYEFPEVAETANRVISGLDNEDRETVEKFRDRLRNEHGEKKS